MNRHHHEVEMEMIFVTQEIERLKKRKRRLKKEYKKAREYWLSAEYVRQEKQMCQ
jgi:chromosome condensin MukBEF ATPase and DNA-binding subunit MukB